MNFGKRFLAVLAGCLALPACDSGESESDGQTVLIKDVEVVVNFQLAPDKEAYQPMWVSGRSFDAGTEANPKPIKCVRSPVNDSRSLRCSLGSLRTSSEIRFMVNIPMENGDSLPACSSTDSNQCSGVVKVTLTGLDFAPPVSLIQDDGFKAGIAYRVLIPDTRTLQNP